MESTIPLKLKINKDTSFIFAESGFKEWKILWNMYIRIALQNIFIRLPQLISFTFIGRLNSSEILASCGLALTFTNVTALSISWGMTSGLITLIPQAIGSRNNDRNILIASYVQQSIVVIIILCIPLSILQLFSGDIMYLIGQPSYLIHTISIYSTNLIPYLWSTPLLLILQRTGRALRFNTELLIIVIITCIINIPLNYIFFYYFNFGYLCSAWSMNISQILSVILSVIMLCIKGYSYLFIPLKSFKKHIINGLYQYLSLSIPGMLTISLSWWTTEISVIFAGYITDKTSIVLSSFVIVSQCNSLGRQLSVGMRSPIAIRVGKYIGYGSIKYAKKSAFIAIVFVDSFVLVFMSCIILIPRKYLATLWSNNIDIIQLSQSLLVIMCCKQIAYNLYITTSAIFMGLGYQKWVAIIVSICHYIIGVPLNIIFLFILKWRYDYIYGSYIIWIVITFAYFLAFIIVLFVLLFCINWQTAMESSRLRITKIINTNNKDYGTYS